MAAAEASSGLRALSFWHALRLLARRRRRGPRRLLLPPGRAEARLGPGSALRGPARPRRDRLPLRHPLRRPARPSRAHAFAARRRRARRAGRRRLPARHSRPRPWRALALLLPCHRLARPARRLHRRRPGRRPFLALLESAVLLPVPPDPRGADRPRPLLQRPRPRRVEK